MVGSTVYLNGVEISHWKSDDRGNFVAKFLSDEIKEMASEGDLLIDKYIPLELVLTGFTIDGDDFEGEQEIMVIDILPQGKE